MQAQNMKALQISTTENDIWHVYPASVVEDDNNPLRVKFTSTDVNCTFRSFGTCFNELDWYALQLLPKEEQDKFAQYLEENADEEMKKNVQNYLQATPEDEKERFLLDYIKNMRWKGDGDDFDLE